VYSGQPSLCLKVRDLDLAREFYEALGFEVIDEVAGLRVALRSGRFRLALMTFLDEDLLNFRGADAFAVHAAVSAAIPGLEGSPERYRADDLENSADADGACCATRDPDGHAILFDTNRNEEGDAAHDQRIADLLRDTEQELHFLRADPALIETFSREIVAKFASRAAGVKRLG
jgi:catechol 2,3-dioxygenase-like lactoylglutathione lyase family enzyme